MHARPRFSSLFPPEGTQLPVSSCSGSALSYCRPPGLCTHRPSPPPAPARPSQPQTPPLHEAHGHPSPGLPQHLRAPAQAPPASPQLPAGRAPPRAGLRPPILHVCPHAPGEQRPGLASAPLLTAAPAHPTLTWIWTSSESSLARPSSCPAVGSRALTTTLSPVRPFARPSTFMAKLYWDGSRSEACDRHRAECPRGPQARLPHRAGAPEPPSRCLLSPCCPLSPVGACQPWHACGALHTAIHAVPRACGSGGPHQHPHAGLLRALAAGLRADHPDDTRLGVLPTETLLWGICEKVTRLGTVGMVWGQDLVPWGKRRGVLILHCMSFRQPLRDPIPCLAPSPGPHCPQTRQGETLGSSRTQAPGDRGPPGVTAWSHRASTRCTAHWLGHPGVSALPMHSLQLTHMGWRVFPAPSSTDLGRGQGPPREPKGTG